MKRFSTPTRPTLSRPVRGSSGLGRLIVPRSALVLAIAAIAAIVLAAAAGADTCPSPDPDADYLCPLGPTFSTAPLTDVAGWDQRSHWDNIFYGDVDGDGLDELVARGTGGVEVFRRQPHRDEWLQMAVPPILADAEGWDAPERYRTIDLGDVDGDGRAELIARGKEGVIVYKFVPGDGELTGSWAAPGATGPYPEGSADLDDHDAGTISLTPLGAPAGKATMQLAARGAKGYELWRWNPDSARWELQAALPSLKRGAELGHDQYVSTAKAWDRETLIVQGPKGMRVYHYLAAKREFQLESDGTFDGPCVPGDGGSTYPCELTTIQFARGVPGAAGDPVVLARDRRANQGIRLARYLPAERRWQWSDLNENPWKEAIYERPEYAATIQAADIDGDGHDEVIGRAEGGFAAFRLSFGEHGRPDWGSPMSVNRPALTGAEWDKAQHYETIDTARLTPGSSARSLVARGPFGIRTWSFDRAKNWFERPRPYGDFPPIDPPVSAAVDRFLGIEVGTVRDLFTKPERSPSQSRLLGLQNQLSADCQDRESAAPPSFGSCRPPSSAAEISAGAWTDAANELLAELFWAREALEHFDRAASIQNDLFLDQQGQAPSMITDLHLRPDNGNDKVRVGIDELIGLAIEFAVASEANVGKAAGAIGLVLNAIGVLENDLYDAERESGSSELEFAIADVQRGISNMQQEARRELELQRRYVLGDPGLAATVGRLSLNGVWTADRLQVLGAGRRAFALSVYRSLLPKIWQEWKVTRCTNYPTSGTNCVAPPAGPLAIVTYPYKSLGSPTTRESDFRAIVPRQQPCDTARPFFAVNRNCSWKTAEQDGYENLVKTLTTPIPVNCRYDPSLGTTWTYGGGCSLGVSSESLFDRSPSSPWTFPTFSCTYPKFKLPSLSCHVAQENSR